MMAAGMITVACTSSVFVMFGNTCRRRITLSVAPFATAPPM